MKKTSLLLVLLVSFGISAKAQFLVDIQFGGNSLTSTDSAPQSGAGVVGSSGDKWNNISFSSTQYGFTASNLMNVSGTGSGVSLAVTSTTQDEFSEGGSSSILTGTSLANLYQGYLDVDSYFGHNTSGTFVFSGLTSGLTYNLYIYSAPNTDRSSAWTLNGTTSGPQTTVGPNSGATVLESPNNYILLTGTADSSGDLTLEAADISGQEIDVNGFQLQAQAVPEPSVYALLAGGLVILFVIQRKRARIA